MVRNCSLTFAWIVVLWLGVIITVHGRYRPPSYPGLLEYSESKCQHFLPPRNTYIAPDGKECVDPPCTSESHEKRCEFHACCVSWKTYCLITEAFDLDMNLRILKYPTWLERHYTRTLSEHCVSRLHCRCHQKIDHKTCAVEVRRRHYSESCPSWACPESPCCWEWKYLLMPGCAKCMNNYDKLDNITDIIEPAIDERDKNDIAKSHDRFPHGRRTGQDLH